MLPDILELAQHLNAAKTSQELTQVFGRYCLGAGALSFNISLGPRLDQHLSDSYPDGWLESLYARDLVSHHNGMRHVESGSLDPYLYGYALDKDAEALTREHKLIEVEAFDYFQRRSAVLMPLKDGVSGETGFVAIGFGDDPAAFAERLRQQGDALQLAANLAFAHSGRFDSAQPDASGSPLTRRELDVLSYLAAGYRTGRIADQLGLSEVTVNLHITNARIKLKALTRAQAVAIAVIRGWVKP